MVKKCSNCGFECDDSMESCIICGNVLQEIVSDYDKHADNGQEMDYNHNPRENNINTNEEPTPNQGYSNPEYNNGNSEENSQVTPRGNKSKGIAFICSFFFPGGGYIYLGEFGTFVLSLILIVILAMISAPLAYFVWFYAMCDSSYKVGLYNEGKDISEFLLGLKHLLGMDDQPISSGKRILVLCCFGIILLAAIGGSVSDENTSSSSDYVVDNSSSYSSSSSSSSSHSSSSSSSNSEYYNEAAYYDEPISIYDPDDGNNPFDREFIENI